MSEKQQSTAIHVQEKMRDRYGDELHHKHNKAHLIYRKHWKSHPAQPKDQNKRHFKSHPEDFQEWKSKRDGTLNLSTSLLRIFKLRKMRKRLDKGRYH